MTRPLDHRTALLCSALACALLVTPTYAGLMDKVKKKVEKTTTDEVDKATGKADAKTTGDGTTATPSASSPAGGGASSGNTKVSAVSTKFDFVPGDKVLFADDFTQDDLGEFPSRWKLVQGTFEIAEMKGERWLRCTSTDGIVRFPFPEGGLPELWTLEFDFYAEEPMGSALTVRGVNDKEHNCWTVTFPEGSNMVLRTGAVFASTALEGSGIGGRHHMMFLGRGPALKAYIDQERLVNAPDATSDGGYPTSFHFRLWASTHPMITNVRFAEGPKPAKDLLADGKLVTHGIRFATGSDVVQPESAPILRQISAWLEANPTAKLTVTGHTDNVGSAASNLDLSKRRAASVVKILGAEFSVAADRLTPDGKGDTEAMASNTTAEGRAMNRRVEFAKL